MPIELMDNAVYYGVALLIVILIVVMLRFLSGCIIRAILVFAILAALAFIYSRVKGYI